MKIPCSKLQSAAGGFDCKEFCQFFDSLANPVRQSALADCGECARCCSSNSFKEFLINDKNIPNKNIVFYQVWVNKFLSFCAGFNPCFNGFFFSILFTILLPYFSLISHLSASLIIFTTCHMICLSDYACSLSHEKNCNVAVVPFVQRKNPILHMTEEMGFHYS